MKKKKDGERERERKRGKKIKKERGWKVQLGMVTCMEAVWLLTPEEIDMRTVEGGCAVASLTLLCIPHMHTTRRT